jgi:hypothetical protein
MYLNYYLFRSRKLHLFFLSLLYMVQTVITYLVMLSAMSFNVWILVAVVLGATFGSWIFGSLRGPYPNASETSKSNSIEVTQQNLLRYYGATTDAAEDEVLGCQCDSGRRGGPRVETLARDASDQHCGGGRGGGGSGRSH